MKRKNLVIGGVVLALAAGAGLFYFFGFGGGRGQALATVNGEMITVDHFLQEVEKVEEPTKGMLKEDPAQLLQMLIVKALLLQEAKRQGFLPTKERGEDEVIDAFLEKRFSAPPVVSKEEIESFYTSHRDRMAEMPLEKVAPMIEEVIRKGKQQDEYRRFVREIEDRASIEVNQERLKGLASRPADTATNTAEELSIALKSGRPVLVDFGSNSCIPCRQLRPILQEIKKEQAGKLEVLVIDVNQHRDLSMEYRIQVIPTLVFFDSKGKEMFRQQGFMPKTALMEQLKKVGIS